ncbi:hypothetical protein [Bartonella sp. DGB1]|uniref:hypothetical protein n=1 Tax=Bartonella sp. DGB1 TaxID=3239807 RepID=UPI003525C829
MDKNINNKRPLNDRPITNYKKINIKSKKGRSSKKDDLIDNNRLLREKYLYEDRPAYPYITHERPTRLNNAAHNVYSERLRGEPLYKDRSPQSSSIIWRSFLVLASILGLLWLSFALYNYNQKTTIEPHNAIEGLPHMRDQPISQPLTGGERVPIIIEGQNLKEKDTLNQSINPQVTPQISPRRQ